MIVRRLAAALYLASLMTLSAAPASAVDYSEANIPARVELRPISSATVTDAEFLRGESGTPVTVAGELTLPRNRTGQLPTIVMLHGSGGISTWLDVWKRELVEQGFAVFQIDGFSGRGLTNVNANQAALGRLNLIVDAYAALDLLADHPRVDPNRVLLLGFSRGGQASLYAAVERFAEAWNHSSIQFAAHVAFYPDCGTTYLGDTDLVDRPIRIFGGLADDYNPVAKCIDYVERIKAAGAADIQITAYPDAYHVFDNPLGSPTPTPIQNAQTVRSCSILEGPEGSLINAATSQPFTYADACVELNPNSAYNAAAFDQARSALLEFLSGFNSP